MDKKERIQAFLDGLTLPAIFAPIMEHLLDNKETTINDVLSKIERGHPGGTKRIKEIFGSTENCIEEAFQHLAERNYALLSRTRTNGRFCLAYSPFLIPGMTHEIFTVKEDGVSIKVDLQTVEDREKIFQEDRRKMLINDWLHDMQMDNLQGGFRQIHSISKLVKSIRKEWHEYSSITIDEYNHVIDGRRRLNACLELGIQVPKENIRICSYESNEDRLLHAWKLNEKAKTWIEEDRKEIEQKLKFLGIDINSKPKYKQINKVLASADLKRLAGIRRGGRSKGSKSRIYLMENPDSQESDAEIARKLGGIGPTSVTQERQNLEGLELRNRISEKRSINGRLTDLYKEFTLEELRTAVDILPLVIKEREVMLKDLQDPEFKRVYIYGNAKEEDDEEKGSGRNGEESGTPCGSLPTSLE